MMILMEGLLAEIKRNRELVEVYKTIPSGKFAQTMLQRDIEDAEEAIKNGDTISMIRCYNTLEGNE